MEIDLVQFLALAVEQGASDLHLCAGSAPMMRRHGVLTPLSDLVIDAETCRDLIYGIFTESQRARFEETWELDFALVVRGLGRFRSNAHYSRGVVEAAFRHIPNEIPSLDELALPPVVKRLCALEQGLVLVTGITGSGKTTTLAAMVEEINLSRSGVIVSIEDPIEYIFTHKLCRVKQREIGADTKSFPAALRHVLRQDPDVILISEMRDLETIAAAITAAETGHLVLATLHTIDAPKAIDRIVDAFPADQQGQIIAQLANSLQAIVAQRLLPRADGLGRIVCTEVMVVNDAIRACLRDRRPEQIISLIEIGGRDGMRTFDESAQELYLNGWITREEALLNARDPARINALPPVKPANRADMNRHVIEVEEKVLREGRDLSLDTAARVAAGKLFTQVGAYLSGGVKYPREADIAYSWRQKEVHAEHEIWAARAEISLHPVKMVVENPHAVPMDNQINEQADDN